MKFNTLDFATVAGAASAILISTRPSRAYANGQPGEVDGLRCDIVCYGNEFQAVSVKIPGLMQPPISNVELTAKNAAKQFVYCTFEGFSGRLYQRREDNSVQVAATASKIILQGSDGK